MVTVHTIEPDCGYQSLGSRDYVVRGYAGKTAGTRLAESWTKLLFFPTDPTLPRGDFLNVKGYVLACPERVARQLSPILEASGELLPIEVEDAGEPYVLWNIVKAIEGLDQERSTWRDAVRWQDAQYAFHAERLPPESQVFRVPMPPSTVFSLGLGNEADFVSRYQALGLTGLTFKKVWESP